MTQATEQTHTGKVTKEQSQHRGVEMGSELGAVLAEQPTKTPRYRHNTLHEINSVGHPNVWDHKPKCKMQNYKTRR